MALSMFYESKCVLYAAECASINSPKEHVHIWQQVVDTM